MIQNHLTKLYSLLPDLSQKKDNNDFWYDLEQELRKLMFPRDEEDAFNTFLFEIYRRCNVYTCEPNEDSFFQKVSLLRLSFSNHKLKQKRIHIAQDIKVLKYKVHLDIATEEEVENLKMLISLKKKL